LLVGGGLGRSYAHEDTFARLAEPLAFVTNEEVEEVIAAIIATYRDLGNRSDRKRARMKYVVADLGLESFRAEVESRLGRALRPALDLPAAFDADDHLGGARSPTGRGKSDFEWAPVECATSKAARRCALRFARSRPGFGVTFFITPQQD